MTNKDKALFEILRISLWGGKLTDTIDAESIIDELTIQAVEGIAATTIPNLKGELDYRLSRFVRMLYVQNEVVSALSNAGIRVVVLKGTAAGIYYPIPYLRRYGDIDLLVHSYDYNKSIKVISDLNDVVNSNIGDEVSDFRINGFSIDLHRIIRGTERAKEGTYILKYIMEGLDDIQWVKFDQPDFKFPILPWKQNGLELIWHIRVHLYNGLGLRQIIDWMLFVNHNYADEESFEDFLVVLNKAGLLRLAKVVTRMCQIYLGLNESINWCSDVEAGLCEDLMQYIIEQGNFGYKNDKDKMAKLLTKYRNPVSIFYGMQNKGLREWRLVNKYKFLRSFAWAYILLKGVPRYFNRSGFLLMHKNLEEKRKRIELFDQLYEEK